MAKKWARGEDVDWEELYTGYKYKPCRISLPTYPFLKERIWYYSIPMTLVAPNSAGSEASKEEPLTVNPAAVEDKYETVKSYLQKVVAEVLGYPPSNPPGIQQGFFDLGMESVQAMQLIAQASSHFDVKMDPTILFDYPNIEVFARYIAEQFNSQGKESLSNGATDAIPMEILYVQSVWKREPGAIPGPQELNKELPGAVLIFDTDNNLRDALLSQFNLETGERIPLVLVKPGQGFRQVGEGIYEIQPGNAGSSFQMTNISFNRTDNQGILF